MPGVKEMLVIVFIELVTIIIGALCVWKGLSSGDDSYILVAIFIALISLLIATMLIPRRLGLFLRYKEEEDKRKLD